MAKVIILTDLLKIKAQEDSYYSGFLKEGKSPAVLVMDACAKELEKSTKILEQARQELADDLGCYPHIYNLEFELNKFRNVVSEKRDYLMKTSQMAMTYQDEERFYGDMTKKVDEKHPKKEGQKDLSDILDRLKEHPDLVAAALLCLDPDLREKAFENSIYRIALHAGFKRKRGSKELAHRTEEHHEAYIPEPNGSLISRPLEELIERLPESVTDKDRDYYRMLDIILKQKCEKELFPLFNDSSVNALSIINDRIFRESNIRLRGMYESMRDSYLEYINMEIPGINPEFEDPLTKKRGVLPSLHQKIALYQIIKEKKFGVFDGCGTGKTAIAVLAKQAIAGELKRQNKNFRRTVVICPNNGKKAWKAGLGKSGSGNEIAEKYLKDEQSVAVINGDKKDRAFLENLKDKEWIVLNYEQLTTKVEDSDKLFVDELIELGVDYLIVDESHHIKSHRDLTPQKKKPADAPEDYVEKIPGPTQSHAVRNLASKIEYLVLLTGSPIPDRLEDYAVQYHLLNPLICSTPADFKPLYEESPRILSTFLRQKTVRRTSADINRDLDWTEIEEFVDLDPLQRKLYDYIKEFNPSNALIQARKALLDPRLVDPELLQKVGLLGAFKVEHSAKYKKLVEILTAKDGPIQRGLEAKDLLKDPDWESKIERFVIFSSMFREGVTQGDQLCGASGVPLRLREDYRRIGLEAEYEKLGLDKSLNEYLMEELKKKYGKTLKIGIIDGTVLDVQDRENTVDRLNTDLIGFVCTAETGGESLNFTRASYGITLDKDYSPVTIEQIQGRLVRKGQKKEVKMISLIATDTLDERLEEYIDRKKLIIKIAVDGAELQKDEESLFNDAGKQLWADERSRMGGKSIDTLDAQIESIEDFQIKRAVKSLRLGNKHNAQFRENETTEAQELMRLIGQDPVNCWKDPKFVELYMKALPSLSVPVVHRAKICDLLGRAIRSEIIWPSRVVSEGSGPSLLYDAYQNLKQIVEKSGFSIPSVVDRDLSQAMLNQGANPNKVQGCMTGTHSAFKDGEFDMVDNESITLLRNPEEVKKSLLEANRILRQDGIIELIVQNWNFKKDFYSGMENLGFQLLTKPNERFGVSKPFFKKLKAEKGEHFAQAYSNKLANTRVLVALKKDKPAEVSSEIFWFDKERPNSDELESVIGSQEAEMKRESMQRERATRKHKNTKPKTFRKPLPGEISGLRLRKGETIDIESE